jgi:hypothetical protein
LVFPAFEPHPDFLGCKAKRFSLAEPVIGDFALGRQFENPDSANLEKVCDLLSVPKGFHYFKISHSVVIGSVIIVFLYSNLLTFKGKVWFEPQERENFFLYLIGSFISVFDFMDLYPVFY